MGYVNMEGKWPSEEDCPGFTSFVHKFQTQVQEVSLKLMACFAIGLGLPQVSRCIEFRQAFCDKGTV